MNFEDFIVDLEGKILEAKEIRRNIEQDIERYEPNERVIILSKMDQNLSLLKDILKNTKKKQIENKYIVLFQEKTQDLIKKANGFIADLKDISKSSLEKHKILQTYHFEIKKECKELKKMIADAEKSCPENSQEFAKFLAIADQVLAELDHNNLGDLLRENNVP